MDVGAGVFIAQQREARDDLHPRVVVQLAVEGDDSAGVEHGLVAIRPVGSAGGVGVERLRRVQGLWRGQSML